MRVLVFFLLFLNGCISYQSGQQVDVSQLESYPVSRVVDGDTFWVDDGSKKGMKIRLLCIDAPEMRATRHKEKGEYAEEATAYLTELISDRSVRLEYDVQRYDQYKRVLAHVYLEDGTYVNGEMIRNGYAQVVTYQPNVMHVDELLVLQKEAQRKGRGLWKLAY